MTKATLRLPRVRFAGWVALVSLAYLLIQGAYIVRLPLVMDEFQGAATVADLTERTPYRDYPPYKTVLGYYVQLPALLIGDPPWQGLVLTKLEMAFVNAGALTGAAILLARLFAPGAVLFGLVLTVLMSNFLERSSELRVDMLTAWAGLFSLLLLLKHRWALAGALAGLSFLISQKGLYYCLSGTVAVALAAVMAQPGDSKHGPLVRFIAGTSATILAYLFLWSLASSWPAVLGPTFLGPRRVTFEQLYDIRATYWLQTVLRNPAFYGFLVLSLLHLLRETHRNRTCARNGTLLAYGLVLLGLAIWHKQPWPYFFVLIIPTAFVLSVAFFDSKLRKAQGRYPLGLSPVLFAVYVVFGIMIPLGRVPINLSRDSGFQRHMVELAACVLGSDVDYVAGVDLLYTKYQPVGMLRWIDRPRGEQLQRLDPTALDAVIDSLDRAPVKLMVDNYRLQSLPHRVRAYLEGEFMPFWGNLRLYGPAIPPGERDVVLKFRGRYSIEAPGTAATRIDGQQVRPGGEVSLDVGVHRASSPTGLRLRLLAPQCEAEVDPAYREPADLFPSVYTY